MSPAALPPSTLHVQQQTIARYAQLTGDFNPLHLDPDFGRNTSMGGTIAHGTMSLSLIYQSLAAGLGADALDSLELDVRFVRPVRPGETKWIRRAGSTCWKEPALIRP